MPVLLAGDTSLDPSFGTWTLNAYASLSKAQGTWPETDASSALVLTSELVGLGLHGSGSCLSFAPSDGDLITISFYAKLVSLNGGSAYLFASFGSNHTNSWPISDGVGLWRRFSWSFIYNATGEIQNPPAFGIVFEQAMTAAQDTFVVDYVQSAYNSHVTTAPTYSIESSLGEEWTAQGLRGEHWYLCAKCQFPYPKSQTVVVTSNSGALVRRCKACVDASRNDDVLPEWNAKRTSVADGESRDSVKEIP